MERLLFGQVPALVAAASTPARAAERGTILVYHPLGRDKSLHAEDLRRLAARGFLAIGVDAIAHGERRSEDAYARFLADWRRTFVEIVAATADEIPGLVDALSARGWAHPGRVGIAGVSLGGFIAYGAVVREPRIAAAACLNASPCWGDDPRSPHLRPEAFHGAALLSVVAAGDAMVPPGEARALHAALAPRYAASPERLRLVELPGEGHHMSGEGFAEARELAEGWFDRFLPGEVCAAEQRPRDDSRAEGDANQGPA